MRLTKNEKRTLKLLLDNAKISDSTIACILKISSQAVGKIRHKLESTVIESYTVNLSYEKLGIHAFAIGIAELTLKGSRLGSGEVEQKLLDDAHIIQVHRIPSGKSKYVILYGFRSLNELEKFFNSPSKKIHLHTYIENKELYPFAHKSIIKNNPIRLFYKVIDEFESPHFPNRYESTT